MQAGDIANFLAGLANGYYNGSDFLCFLRSENLGSNPLSCKRNPNVALAAWGVSLYVLYYYQSNEIVRWVAVGGAGALIGMQFSSEK